MDASKSISKLAQNAAADALSGSEVRVADNGTGAVPNKPGYKTTEFWLSLLVALPGILVMAGIVPASDEPNLETLLTKITAGVAATVAVWKYTHSRLEIKKANNQ